MEWKDIRNDVMREVEAISIIADETRREYQVMFSDGEIIIIDFDKVFDFCNRNHEAYAYDLKSFNEGPPIGKPCFSCAEELGYVKWFSRLMAKEGFKQITWDE